MKTLEQEIYKYLHYNHTTPCEKMAKEIVQIIKDHKKAEEALAKEKADEFDRDRYADDNKGWKADGFEDSNGWKHYP